MLHAKFQDQRTSGSGEEDFQRFLPYMGGRPSWPKAKTRYVLMLLENGHRQFK